MNDAQPIFQVIIEVKQLQPKTRAAYPQGTDGVTNQNFFCIQEGPKVEPAQWHGRYNVYYSEFGLKTSYWVNGITVFNNFSDPKTSRGTLTTVSITPDASKPFVFLKLGETINSSLPMNSIRLLLATLQ